MVLGSANTPTITMEVMVGWLPFSHYNIACHSTPWKWLCTPVPNCVLDTGVKVCLTAIAYSLPPCSFYNSILSINLFCSVCKALGLATRLPFLPLLPGFTPEGRVIPVTTSMVGVPWEGIVCFWSLIIARIWPQNCRRLKLWQVHMYLPVFCFWTHTSSNFVVTR